MTYNTCRAYPWNKWSHGNFTSGSPFLKPSIQIRQNRDATREEPISTNPVKIYASFSTSITMLWNSSNAFINNWLLSLSVLGPNKLFVIRWEGSFLLRTFVFVSLWGRSVVFSAKPSSIFAVFWRGPCWINWLYSNSTASIDLNRICNEWINCSRDSQIVSDCFTEIFNSEIKLPIKRILSTEVSSWINKNK